MGRLKRLIGMRIRRAIGRGKDWFREAPVRDQAYLYPALASMYWQVVSDAVCATRPQYAWGVVQGVSLARALRMERASVVEFGVAGGNGLVALERVAERVEALTGVGVDVYGFDTGRGMPEPRDVRDCPNLWSASYFSMDVEKLKQRLRRAKLLLGLVEETVSGLLQMDPAPVAFVSFDLDYYSSTTAALKLLEAPEGSLLPRVVCYFDDVMGFTYGEYNGERLAIAEFNRAHETRKISPIFGLKYFVPSPFADTMWVEQFWMAHLFDHSLYGHHDGLVRSSEMPLQ